MPWATYLHGMKAMVLSLVLGLFVVNTHAQTWCPPGAEWWYVSTGFGAFDVIHMWYVADSTVGDRTANLVGGYTSWGPGDQGGIARPNEISSLQDGVFWRWSQAAQAWDTLIWFDCGFNEHWNMPFDDCTETSTLYMQDTGRVTIDGLDLKFWDFRVEYEFDSQVFSYDQRFIDRLGIDPWRLPRPICNWGDFGGYFFRCYQDDEIQYRSSEYEAIYGPACPISTGVASTSSSNSLGQPFPNPGTDQFTLSGIEPGTMVRVFDALGRCVIEVNATSSFQSVDATELTPGFYRIRIGNDGDGNDLAETVIRPVQPPQPDT